MTALWIGFIAAIVALLLLDLGLFHRKAHVVDAREALLTSAAWIGLGLLFTVFVYFGYDRHWFGMDLSHAEPDGKVAAIAYLTGYVVEKSLSVDNLCVIAMIFQALRVPQADQHRVLFWGILAALALRCVMILVGSLLIEQFHWILYLFGLFLIFAAVRMFVDRPDVGPKGGGLLRLVRRLFPVTDELVGQRFLVRVDGRLMLTPLALALVAVEAADVVFALDSIPAIFAITEDQFLVFTSNVFALLGLRSLYFALAHVIVRFHYLNRSLAAILALVGLKLLLKDVLHTVPGIMYYLLAAIVLLLAAGVGASLLWPKRTVSESAISESSSSSLPLREKGHE